MSMDVLKLFIQAIKTFFKKEVEIKNPDKRIINELKKYDEIYLNKRLCVYGGHMINLFNSSKISFVDLIDPKVTKNDLPEGPLKSWF